MVSLILGNPTICRNQHSITMAIWSLVVSVITHLGRRNIRGQCRHLNNEEAPHLIATMKPASCTQGLACTSVLGFRGFGYTKHPTLLVL